jgi:serine/threonine protein kinase
MTEIKTLINQIPIIGQYAWLLIPGIIVLTLGWLMLRILRRPKSELIEEPEEIIEVDDFIPDKEEKLSIDREDIVKYFLKIFKAQLGETQDVLSEIKPLDSSAIEPKKTFELRVVHDKEWQTRRMTVGPAGDEGASRSKCYYVIYDDHLVLKIPPKPIKDFDSYIQSIIADQEIVKKLAPKECIVPGVSAILNRVHPFSSGDTLSPLELEDKYIKWLSKFPAFQEYLKISGSFVFVMDLSKYFFLGHIINDIHDLDNRMFQELVGYPAVIWETHGFEGRYGFESDAVVDGIKKVYYIYEEKAGILLKRYERVRPVDNYVLQKWFLFHLAGREIETKEKELNDELVDKFNRLIHAIFENYKKPVEAYQETIKGCIQSVTVEQNRSQMGGLIANILDLLTWLKAKGVAMRDLKPDNLLIVGDNSKYPDFLDSIHDYTIGLIDVETAVEYHQNENNEIGQPILGGTPSYATLSHLCKNESLNRFFEDLSQILYLQDWYASLGMIYELILGEPLFKQTGKLLVGIKDLVLKPAKEENQLLEVFKKASRMFWYSAVNEFNTKTSEKEEMLSSVKVTITKKVRDMLKEELLKGKKINLGKIKHYVNNQKVFKSDKHCQGLICASGQKISQLKKKWAKGFNNPRKLPEEKARALKVLQDLEQLKYESEEQSQWIQQLGQPDPMLSAHDLLTLMFGIVLSAMHPQSWGELSPAEGMVLEDVAGSTTIENTV